MAGGAKPPRTAAGEILIIYQVWVTCPHCGKNLNLSSFPYSKVMEAISDDKGKPIKSDGIDVTVRCYGYGCKRSFSLVKVKDR